MEGNLGSTTSKKKNKKYYSQQQTPLRGPNSRDTMTWTMGSQDLGVRTQELGLRSLEMRIKLQVTYNWIQSLKIRLRAVKEE